MMYNWIVKKPETAAAIYKAISAGTCTTPGQVAAIAAEYADEIFWTGAVPKGKNGVETIAAATRILLEIGVPASLLGYQYVREAINLAAQDISMSHRTGALYADVAEKFDTTDSRVERAIRVAIEATWERGNLDALHKYFGYSISADRGRATNGEFIAMVADHIRREAE